MLGSIQSGSKREIFPVFLPTKSKITLLPLGVWVEEYRAWRSLQAALLVCRSASHFIPLGLEVTCLMANFLEPSWN